MWHEARKQEKMLRAAMVDQSKRAERKRKYFDNVRKDPEHFMQIHGRKSQIHADRSIAKAAEDVNILRAWQGDQSITIDRFDVRSHLSKMDLEEDENNDKKSQSTSASYEKEEIVCEFERYRVLIINSFKGVTEKMYLRKIAEREFWQDAKESNKKLEFEKKKKLSENKSSIGFSYEDSEVVKGRETVECESDDDIPEPEDIDADLDIEGMNPEARRKANNIGEEFGIKRGLFCGLLKTDQQAQKDAAQLKQIDRQKAALSGRESKHERMLLRRQRQAIVGKGCQEGSDGATATLLSFINKSQKKSLVDEMMSESESSGDEKAVPEFITTFGGEEQKEDDDDDKTKEAGPALPSEQYRKILELSRKRDQEDLVDWGDMKIQPERGRRKSSPNRKRSSRSHSRTRRRSRSTDRRRSRSRSRDRRRLRSRSPYMRRRSRSRSQNRYRSRSRDRRRSRSRVRDRKRSHSLDRKSSRRRSRDPKKSGSVHQRRYKSRERRRSRSRSTRRRQRSSSSSSSSSNDSSISSSDRSTNISSSSSPPSTRESPMKSPSGRILAKTPEPETMPVEESAIPAQVVSPCESSDNEDDVKMLEIRSSMSESEKEKIEIENRKRRIKLTKKMVKIKQKSVNNDSSDDEEIKKIELAKKMRQKLLKKSRQELTKEKEEKRRKAELEKRVRDELRFIEDQERIERERGRRRRYDDSSQND